ncbi:MAG: phenylalanine 4-monooxygenase [Phycisphaeraceae bacterium]|nr:phenylalanine 4-monooxygenase [Phycisphaeraceae bacterium]MCB9847354.1 phenylalanine 4-monooxygenase [Phycisphaeraceae bacterium]
MSSIWHPVIDGEEAQQALKAAERSQGMPPDKIDIESMMITQHYEKYSEEDHEVWRLLVEARMKQLPEFASNIYLAGLRAINLKPDRIPDLNEVNARLGELTGWSSRGVPGFIPAKSFFAFIAQRVFPATISIRPKDKLEYLPEPDIVHDIFGHVPLHANEVFADFLQTYGQAALHTDDPVHTERLARLFWFTVEFGLIHEDGKLKLYGSGLISSEGEGHHALESKDVERRPFDMETVCNTAFEIDHYQPILYVLEDFEQLRDSMNKYAEMLLNQPAGSASR